MTRPALNTKKGSLKSVLTALPSTYLRAQPPPTPSGHFFDKPKVFFSPRDKPQSRWQQQEEQECSSFQLCPTRPHVPVPESVGPQVGELAVLEFPFDELV